MSFQWIVDNAEEIQINKRGIVAQTVSRDQTVRSVSRGGAIWRFTVTPPSGYKWADARGYVETIDNSDRFTVTQINFSKTAYAYIFGYQGNGAAPTSITVTQGSPTAQIGGGYTGGIRLKAGDLVQLSGQPYVYSVVNTVTLANTSVTLNRPVLETSGTYTLVVGQNVSFKLICTQIPDYKITPGGLIQWTGPFTFVESLA